MDLNLRVERIAVLACLSHAEDPGEQLIGGAQRHHAQHNGAKAANLVFRRNRTPGPRGWRIARSTVVDKRESLTLRVLQIEDQPVVSLDHGKMGNLE
jgi:hypothetical protein